MSVIKDFHEQHLHINKNYWLRELVNPFNWYSTLKWRHQRAERGWSDRDTWNGGDYILEVSAGVLLKLGDQKSHIDWAEYFRTNHQTRGYESLEAVAQDIQNYLDFQETSWIDDLGFDIKHGTDEEGFLKSENTPDEERRIRLAMRKWHDKETDLYTKAKNAMIFVAINYRGLWD